MEKGIKTAVHLELGGFEYKIEAKCLCQPEEYEEISEIKCLEKDENLIKFFDKEIKKENILEHVKTQIVNAVWEELSEEQY